MRKIMRVFAAVIVFSLLAAGASADEEKWAGVDEVVVKKIAREANRPGAEPLIPLEGDAALFAFLIAGATGGFVGGYYYRELFSRKRKE
ncbi:MAG: hypothetical protein PHG91_10880 [Syntrophales bacterium]|nr:hypothetical protein [Syntrophales bacterium]MDD5233886.1 hypothetical protein [Syntrophales bacterium]MDD5531472.1 hypothetical protein [Syntrophales bacterium]